MPLAKRIIPTLLCRGRQLVKGVAFDSWRSVGHAAQAVRIHQARGVDELCLLDIGATPEGRGPDLKLVEELSEVCFMPLAVGGGVRSIADVRALLNAGADKVVIRTGAITNPRLVADCASVVGCQAIVVALDVRGGRLALDNWTDHEPALYPALMAKAMERLGAGEILLTSIEREGKMEGYDLELIRAVSRAVDVPVIAHGGCGNYHHMVEAVNAGASAVAAGAMFQFTDLTPGGAARYLQQHGIEARIT